MDYIPFLSLNWQNFEDVKKQLNTKLIYEFGIQSKDFRHLIHILESWLTIISIQLSIDIYNFTLISTDFESYKKLITLYNKSQIKEATLQDIKRFTNDGLVIIHPNQKIGFSWIVSLYNKLNSLNTFIAVWKQLNLEIKYLNNPNIKPFLLTDILRVETFKDSLYKEAKLNNLNKLKEIKFYGKELINKWDSEKENKAFEFIKTKCYNKLKKMDKFEDPIYRKRLVEELKVLKKSNFCLYIANVYNIVYLCRKENILVWGWRGSSVSSLILYLMDINLINPLNFNLDFERFLNANKIADIDIDVSSSDRLQLEQVLNTKYKNKIAKLIVDKGNSWSEHPTGFLITDSDIMSELPLFIKEDQKFCQWTESNTNKYLSKLHYLKYDFLNSKLLDSLKEYLNKNNIALEQLYKVDVNNWNPAWTEFIKNNSEYLFQMGSESAKKILKIMPIDSFDKLIKFNAINRPSVYSQNLFTVINHVSKNRIKIYHNEYLDNLLKETNWFILYQEQAISISEYLLQMPYKDIMRIVKEHKTEELEQYKARFLANCQSLRLTPWDSNMLWNGILGFSFYWLNKAHAVSYAYLILFDVLRNFN